MAFGATANPATVPALGTGQTQDVVFTFTDVPADAAGTETFNVPGHPAVEVTLNFLAPNPESVAFTIPPNVTRDLISIDDSQAVIRYTGV